MARTIRNNRKGKGKTRDGADIRAARSCGNHGSCPYCRDNRLHKHKRRAPV